MKWQILLEIKIIGHLQSTTDNSLPANESLGRSASINFVQDHAQP